jgi:hypothetical protein
MAMTPQEVQNQLNLLNKPQWSRAEVESWLGINLAEAHPLLAQFQMWNTGSYEAAFETLENIDRGRFAIFLESSNYVPLRGAAVSLALTDDSFREVMAAERTRQLFPSEVQGAFPNVYRMDFVSVFFKQFPRMRQSVFPDNDAFFRILHEQIHECLQVRPVPRLCETSRALGENPQHFGASLDSITQEPMCTPYQVFLNTKMPTRLRPDCCSWLTYFRFEDILKPALLGSPPDCTPEQEVLLRRYEGGN